MVVLAIVAAVLRPRTHAGPAQSTSAHTLLLAFAVVPVAFSRCMVLATVPDERPPPFSTPLARQRCVGQSVNDAHCTHRHAPLPRTLGASQLLNTRHCAHYAAARRRNATLH
ncbi:hypothetical protein FB451DRAFT_1240547 [Mycena latifolia]|nr:hypothetical protein FB451DRAFT_1240547 [Mycena latifolia]